MIKAVLKTNGSGVYQGFEVSGHSGSNERGKDIICAAVSSIVQATLIGIEEVAGINDTYRIDDGYVKCDIPSDISEKQSLQVQTLIATMHLGLKSIAMQYHNFVRIKED